MQPYINVEAKIDRIVGRRNRSLRPTPADVLASAPQVPAQTILTPEKAQGTPLETCPLSARRRHIHEASGIRLAGQVHEQCNTTPLGGCLEIPSHSRPPGAPASASPAPARTIFIPEEARGTPLVTFPVSVRLRYILAARGIRLAGQLHGMAFADFLAFRNCGRKTVTELQALVGTIQRGPRTSASSGEFSTAQEPSPPVRARAFFVPASAQAVNPFDLPLSVRLEGTLRRRKIVRLGDLDGVSLREFRRIKNVGKKTTEELVRLIECAARGEFGSVAEGNAPWNPSEFVRTIDALIGGLTTRDRDILLLRIGGSSDKLLTLDEVGAKFGLTRERIRQIYRNTVACVAKLGSLRLRAYLKHIANACKKAVCPLTPDLLTHWVGGDPGAWQFPLVFYVRLLGELSADISAWPEGQEPGAAPNPKHGLLVSVLEDALRSGIGRLSLRDAYALAKAHTETSSFTPGEFLCALKNTKRLKVQFKGPTVGEVLLPSLLAAEVARVVLRSSEISLTPEEILARAKELFGDDLRTGGPQTLGGSLTEEKGFYLLGPRSYGFREHILLPENLWRRARSDFREMLRQASNPISTAEVVNNHRFVWTAQTNAYELACILRGDNRFIDLGKFLFALAEWGIEEREYVKDLIPIVLAEAARPLTRTQVSERLQQLRSCSPTSISSHLRKHPEVHDYGFGHYGLKSWGASAKASIVADAAPVERIIRRAAPPLTFVRLCEILAIPSSGPLADTLWQTCSALREVLRIPEEHSDNTRLIHRTCRLERALVATAREVNRPLPLYELVWKLNERFGQLFNNKSLEDIRRCLEQCPPFLRNAAGQFILDIHLDQLGLDTDAIRRACAEVLSQSNKIVGCEDLLERLEADGKSWEELSPDILSSLLRDDPMFQEIGRDRFRLNTRKH